MRGADRMWFIYPTTWFLDIQSTTTPGIGHIFGPYSLWQPKNGFNRWRCWRVETVEVIKTTTAIFPNNVQERHTIMAYTSIFIRPTSESP
jgi:hypothetical protein